MKNKRIPVIIIMLLLAAGAAFAQKHKDNEVQKIKFGKAVGAVYYPAEDIYLVSNIGAWEFADLLKISPDEDPYDWKGYIVVVKFSIDSFIPYTLLPNITVEAPGCMEIKGDSLYIVEEKESEIVGYNLATKQVFTRVKVDTSNNPRLRDICYAGNNIMYISGLNYNAIYKYNIATDSVEKLQTGGDEIRKPFGLLYESEGNRILIVTHEENARILSLDLDSAYVRTIRTTDYDQFIGIARDGSGRYHISSYSRSTLWPADYFTLDSGLTGEMIEWNRPWCHEVYYDSYNDFLVMVLDHGPLIEPLYYNEPVSFVYPTNNAQNVETDLKFEWNRQTNTYKYRFILSDSPSPAEPIVDDFIYYPDSTFSIENLDLNKTYYWTVIAYADEMNYSPSSTFTFTTSSTEKPTPQLIYPPNDSTNLKTFQTLQWAAVENAGYCILQICIEEDMKNPFINIMLNDTSLYYDDFGFETDYYWRVKSTKGSGGSPWSPISHFYTAEPYLDIPEMISPLHGQYVADTNILFEWDTVENADNYRFKIRGFHDDGGYVVYYNIDSLSFYLTGFLPGESYNWGVRACNTDGYGDWAFAQNHIPDSIISPPIIRPIPGGNPQTLKPTLTWTDIGADSYELEIAETDAVKGIKGIIQQQSEREFRNKTYSKSGIKDTSHTLEKSLIKDKNYIWRVRGEYSGGVISKWALPVKFSTTGKVSVDDGIFNESLALAYPNPVYDFLKLIVESGMDENTTLELYDAYGSKVRAIYRLEFTGGKAELSVNTAGLGSGAYQAVIKSGEKVYTAKFSVVK